MIANHIQQRLSVGAVTLRDTDHFIQIGGQSGAEVAFNPGTHGGGEAFELGGMHQSGGIVLQKEVV